MSVHNNYETGEDTSTLSEEEIEYQTVEEPAQEEPLVEEPFVEEEVILPVVTNKYGKTDDSLRVRGRDGNIWDGTGTITVGTTTYNADAREVHVAEVAPVMTPKSEIVGILNIGSSFDALGWTRGFQYKGDERYWVDTYDNRIPVRSTSEKPV